MEVLSDGLRMLWEYRQEVVILYLMVAGLGGWFDPDLRVTNVRRFAQFSFRMMTGLALLVLAVLLFGFLGLVWAPSLAVGAAILVLLAAGGWIFAGFRRMDMLPAVGFVLVLLAVLVMRLAFVSDLFLPPYRDAAQHYQIVQGFLHPGLESASRYWGAGGPLRVYHFGFHGLAAWLALTAGSDRPLVLAFLGQVLLALYPFAVFALASELCRDWRSAGFSALLAGFGWAMPAFAANWAKYPAIGALALLPVVLAVGVATRPTRGWSKWLAVTALAAAGICMHTRLAVVFGLLLPGLAAGLAWPFGRRPWLDWLLFGGAILAATWANWWVLLAGYANWVLLAGLVVLLPLAFRSHPRAAVVTAATMLGIGLAVSVHTPSFLRAASPYWLDRPFAQMLLSLPLAVLGGLGLDGGLEFLGKSRAARGVLLTVLLLIVGWSAWPRNHYYPDACCNYVRPDDVAVLQWIDENLTPESTMIIAGFRERKYLFETDAGMWVGVLTDVQVQKMDYKTDFGTPQVRERICPYGDVYIYLGSMPFSFDRRLLMNGQGFGPAYQSGMVSILHVDGCNGGQ